MVKVDELMALCDQMEAAREERERRRDRLAAASLRRIQKPAEDENTFREHVRFHFANLSKFTHRLDQIPVLRKTILDLAVRGRLVRQEPNDEPATALMKRVDQERGHIAKTDRRAAPGRQELLASESCWEIPPTWCWMGLADLVLFIDYRGKTPAKTSSGIRLLTAKNVRQGFINMEPEEFISNATYNAWMTRGLPRDGDVLFTTEAPMGNAAVVRLNENFGLAQRVINFRLYGSLDPDFMALQLRSAPFQTILDKTATGLTAKGIKAAKLKRLPFAIPPLPEQHRIVAKVDELMGLCDRLETQLTTAQNECGRLLDAVLHQALEPTLEEVSA